jgi:uncharacterized membrane protein SpoIIM required for sporulation
MVIESLVNPFIAKKHPWNLFFFGFFYTSIAMLVSHWVFEEYASLIMIFLTVFAAVPLLYKTLKMEEETDLKCEHETQMLREHSKALTFLLFLFLGMVAAFSLWYIVLPSSMANNLFRVQFQMITSVNQQITGNATQSAIFSRILLNNIKVMIFCVLFSFIYGAGAIFILAWNASVIGAAIGNFVRTNIASYSSSLGLGKFSAYFYTVSLGFVRYFIHGIPEILAYFIAALAGGIISVAVINHAYTTKRFEKILLDASDLILISIAMLFAAALLEVYVTPLFF